MVGAANLNGPESGLTDAETRPNLQGHLLEPLEQVGHATRHGVVDPLLVDHRLARSGFLSEVAA